MSLGSRFAIGRRSRHDYRVGQNLLTRFEDLLSGVKRVFYPPCLSGVGCARRGSGGSNWTCMRTYSIASAAALDRIDMFGTRLLRLRIRRTSTRQYTLLETESPGREQPLGVVQTFQAPRSIDQRSGASSILASLIEFARTAA